jgi:hypothetical protein
MAGFDLSAKLTAITALAGLPTNGETIIQTLSSMLRVAPQGIQVDALNLIAPSIGTLTGSGTIAPRGAMDFTETERRAAFRRVRDSLAETFRDFIHRRALATETLDRSR